MRKYEKYSPEKNSWENSIIDWLMDPLSADQGKEGKTNFVRTAKVGSITRLSSLGISNGVVRKKSKEFYKLYKSELSMDELLLGLDHIFMKIDYTEAHMFVMYTLENFKHLVIKADEKQLGEFFDLINQRWIDHIDHWTSSDHLCINAM